MGSYQLLSWHMTVQVVFPKIIKKKKKKKTKFNWSKLLLVELNHQIYKVRTTIVGPWVTRTIVFRNRKRVWVLCHDFWSSCHIYFSHHPSQFFKRKFSIFILHLSGGIGHVMEAEGWKFWHFLLYRSSYVLLSYTAGHFFSFDFYHPLPLITFPPLNFHYFSLLHL